MTGSKRKPKNISLYPLKKPNLRKQVVPPRQGGFTLPGHDFLGPLNAMDYAVPRNREDVFAKEHDIAYGTAGANPYFHFNKADQKLIDELSASNTAAGKIAQWYFKIKKRVAPHEVTPDQPVTQKKKNISPPEKHSGKRSFQEFATDLAGNIESLSNLPPSKKANLQRTIAGTMAEGAGSGNKNGLKETPIDEVTEHIERGPPNYTFASLPALRQSQITATVFSDQLQFRMTSPYDWLVNNTLVDQNAGTGAMPTETSVMDTSDSTVTKANWWDYYAGLYKYYHVVACRWHLTLENKGDAPIWVHQWYQNETDRPQGAGNLDMLAWPDTLSHYVECQAAAITSNGQMESTELVDGGNGPSSTVATGANFETSNMVSKTGRKSPILQISGEYRPGDYDREIRLDTEVENWTETNTNPRLSERLCIRIRPLQEAVRLNSTESAQDAIKYFYFVRLEYLVEFKELRDNLRYPLQKQPLTVTIAADAATE
jgi:hypothetical protein